MLVRAIFNHLCISLGNILPKYQKFFALRVALYRAAGMIISQGTAITGPITLRAETTSKIKIGKNCFLNSETRFGCQDDEIVIGNDVLVGPRVSFETAGHNLIFQPGIGRGFVTRPILVKDRVWIGAGSIILQGVTIGEGAVVAAGSVVRANVDPYTLVGGVPAKRIRSLNAEV